MPSKPSRPCPGRGRHKGFCRNLLRNGERLCPVCAKLDHNSRRDYYDRRGTTDERGYGGDWQKLKAYKMKLNPLCEVCESKGMTKPARIVHHVKTVKDRPDLRLNINNLMCVCFQCHEEIHADERFGRGEIKKAGWSGLVK